MNDPSPAAGPPRRGRLHSCPAARVRVRGGCARALTLLAVALLPAAAARAGDAFVFGPYKDAALFQDPAAPAISVMHEGRPAPIVQGPTVRLPAGVDVVAWAFATGECGEEKWGAAGGREFAEANVRAFDNAGVRYIVSTGGADASFTCATDAGMERFVARYWSARMAGIDFDIERDQSDEQIASLVRRAREAQRRRPALRVMFTIATWAATDGTRRSLNPTGEKVLRAIRAAGLRDYTLNLMVMNYGPADAAHCVVVDGRCDMARSALQAAENVSRRYRVPLANIAVTPMLGVNDVQANVFSPDDARVLARAARGLGLAGLHYWSLDRDRPCTAPPPVQSTCHGLPGVTELEFTRALQEGRQPVPGRGESAHGVMQKGNR